MYNAIDLFSGAGGLHLGFEKAGFDIRLCIDNNDLVEKTHKKNYPNIPFINKDINKVEISEIPEEDLHDLKTGFSYIEE